MTPPAPGKFLIREFRTEDLPRLHEIRTAAFAPVYQSFRALVGPDIAAVAFASAEAEQGAHLDEICSTDSAHSVYVIELNGQIIGFSGLSCDEKSKVGEIGLNAVDPQHKGQGAGSALYAHVLDQMRRRGMKVATVGTGGDESHAPARRAYEKAGFAAGVPSVWLYRTL